LPQNWPDLNTVRNSFKNPNVVNPKYLTVSRGKRGERGETKKGGNVGSKNNRYLEFHSI
jgi:hypothetical protein